MDVAAILNDTIRWPEMSADILSALGPDAEAEFEMFMQRVEGRFRTTPRYANVLRFMRDHSKLRNDELLSIFEFIYSSLVNNLKGELGELFARPRIHDFTETIGVSEAPIVLGSRIRERSRRRARGWLKGADALVGTAADGRFEIRAVVEIKAMQHPLPRIVEQLDGHVARMRQGGLKIDEEDYPASAIDIRYPDGTVVALATATDVPGLIVRPWIRSEDGAILPHPDHRNLWIAELRYSQDEITEAAYRLTDWLFARLGAEVFYLPGEEPRGRVPAPHPEDTLEENGRNSFRAALFGVWRREIFQPRAADAPRGGKRTPADTFLWLYNSICGGYDQATTEDIYFPDFVPDDAYEARRQRWIAARTAFVRNAYEDAAASLPDPADQTDLWSRRREWLLKARIHIHRGATGEAIAALERAYQDHHPRTCRCRWSAWLPTRS